MKYKLILISFLALSACASHKTVTEVTEQQQTANVIGKIESVQRGKDGYTARIITDDGAIYYATVSVSNLNDPKQYKDGEPGMTIQVKGDYWEMEAERHITVRELMVVKI